MSFRRPDSTPKDRKSSPLSHRTEELEARAVARREELEDRFGATWGKYEQAAAVGVVALAVIAGGTLDRKDNDQPNPDRQEQPTSSVGEMQRFGDIRVTGTTLAIPDEPGEGVESLVREEAEGSNVSIDWDTTQKLVDAARALNQYPSPRLGEPYAIPDIADAPDASMPD